MTTFLLIASVVCFISSLRYLFQLKNAGIFPPKRTLKKRASALALGGAGFLVLAFMVSLFHK